MTLSTYLLRDVRDRQKSSAEGFSSCGASDQPVAWDEELEGRVVPPPPTELCRTYFSKELESGKPTISLLLAKKK